MPPSDRAALAELLAPLLGHGSAKSALALGLRSLILDGRLVADTRIPSERDLAADLGVSRATVTSTYDRLRREGFLASDHGAGTRVRLAGRSAGARPDEADHSDEPKTAIDLTIAALPAPGILPELVAQAAGRLSPHLAGHGLSPLGLPELRAAIAARYSQQGLPTAREEILVTQGALHGWDLILRAHSRPGQSVLIEQPTYPSMLDAARAHRMRLAPLRTDADGWHPANEDASRPAALALLTPDFQNPTGLQVGTAERRRLLRTAPNALIVADETFRELALEPVKTSPLPLAALAPARTFTLGSLSKPVWAGLRIGWIRGPETALRALATARTGQDLGSPIVDQLVALGALEHLDDILAQRQPALLRQRDALLADLGATFPCWQVRPPAGGLVLWVDMGPGQSSSRLALAARSRGVRLTPGTRFSVAATHDRFLRLPFTLPPSETRTALALLAKATEAPAPQPLAGPAREVWTA